MLAVSWQAFRDKITENLPLYLKRHFEVRMPEQTRKFLEEIEGFPPLHLLTPEEIRKVVVSTAISDFFELAGKEDYELHGPHGSLPVRLYRPVSAKAGRPLPVIVFFHGGGFVFNSMEQ